MADPLKNPEKKPESERRPAQLEAVPDVCREMACDDLATTGGYCRAHYIKNWMKIKQKQQILQTGQFRPYVENLLERYPEDVIAAIREDLSSDETLEKLIAEYDASEESDEIPNDMIDDDEIAA